MQLMKPTEFIPDESAQVAFGASLSAVFKAGDVVFLQGDLGAGKTTLVRGFVHALGYSGPVNSPTFTLVEPYQLTDFSLFHFDLYRMDSPNELEFIGARDMIGANDGLCFIEWPDKGRGFLPEPDYLVDIRHRDEGREITVWGR